MLLILSTEENNKDTNKKPIKCLSVFIRFEHILHYYTYYDVNTINIEFTTNLPSTFNPETG